MFFFADNWNTLRTWSDVLSLSTFIEFLNEHFIPEWLETFEMCIEHPLHKPISDWITKWKSLLPNIFVDYAPIENNFQTALDTINQAAKRSSVVPPSSIPPIPSSLTNIDQNINVNIILLSCTELRTE